ncbi:MAG: phenylalanine--tRNA ligase subunit beta [Treponema sp.]|nr:MAG: phenylalanine--tRNA ligase subunit beta [Treponema sp.]
MPKIEVNERIFFELVGEEYNYESLEEKLPSAKAELDEWDENSSEGSIKIELNDTNRPDLWSTSGLARLLRIHRTGRLSSGAYENFLSNKLKQQNAGTRVIKIDASLKDIRPFLTAFVISGKPIDEAMLQDIIQTQEKLCTNFGRKRKTVSMGVYRSDMIKWPVQYTAADPDNTKFIPLATADCDETMPEMSLREILTKHPKGKEYAGILENFNRFPILKDIEENILSFPPIINSADIGAAKVGDTDLLVEFTGTDMDSLLLATNIVACDFADSGYKILPVTVHHVDDTGYGMKITTPFYFQEPAFTSLDEINKLLGSEFSLTDVETALRKMDCKIELVENKIKLYPPAYRNDFLHEVDIIEDVMIGFGVENFTPESPSDFTIGRLMKETLLSRKIKNLMTGFGFQEMIFNYLGSEKDFIERMNVDGKNAVEILNPMSENYKVVRPSILPSLLLSEMNSAHAVYPHKIFETGKVAYLDDTENTGTTTRQHLGFLTAMQDANYNEAASIISGLMYYLGVDYSVKETSDPRFIQGRQANVIVDNKAIGIFGEVCPEVLENWDITIPCFAGEIDLTCLIQD